LYKGTYGDNPENIPDELKEKVKLPKDDSQIKHIFRSKQGHLEDTPENREMNKFEFFTMIFYALDLYYDQSPTEELERYLGAMNPFTFKENESADPAVYADYCRFITDKKIDIENSYELAIEYLDTITELDLTSIFKNINKEKWIEGCRDYMSNPHKGSE
jgi:hypothetical protein